MAHLTPLGDVGDFGALGRGNGQEESMQSFIHHHILTALGPVTDHVRELQQQLEHVSKDLALTDSKVEENTGALNRVDRDLLDLRTGHGQLTSWMGKAKMELAKEAEVRHKAEREHDATRLALAKANERHQHCMAAVEKLERGLGQLGAGVEGLKGSMVQAEQGMEVHARGLVELKDAQEDLAVRHQGTMDKADRAHELGEGVERELARLAKSHGRGAEETSLVLSDLGESVRTLQDRLGAQAEAIDKQGLDITKNAGLLQSVKSALDHKDGVSRRLDSMQAKDEEHGEGLKKHSEDLDRLRKKVEAMCTHDGSTNDSGGGSLELMEELRLRLEQIEGDVGKLGGTQAAHITNIKDAVLAIERLQRDQGRMREHADATEQELVELLGSHKQALNKMNDKILEQSRLQSDLHHVSRDVNSSLQQVKGDLGAQSGAVAKLRSHQEACSSNFFGLARGFQDAGRQVVGSPKAPLPALEPGRTPRGPASRILNDTQPRPAAAYP